MYIDVYMQHIPIHRSPVLASPPPQTQTYHPCTHSIHAYTYTRKNRHALFRNFYDVAVVRVLVPLSTKKTCKPVLR